MLNIDKILPTVLKSEDDWKHNLLANWPHIVGSLKTRIRLEKIQDSTLIIGVYESHWMQELYLLSNVLIKAINTHLNQQKISQVRFKLVEVKQVKKNLKAASKTLKLYEHKLTEYQKQMLDKVKDPDLRLGLERFLVRCMEG